MYNSESDSESDSDSDYEEENNKRFNIGLCELYNINIHGIETSEVLTHYLVRIKYKKININNILNDAEYINNQYIEFNLNYHNTSLNYRQTYIKPEIIECLYLNSGHCVAIIKTFWIKIIQRTWKNIFKKNKIIIQNRKSIISLHNRELTGKWPINCYNLYHLKGMLFDLKRRTSCCGTS
jgi:hypothetical protein